MAAPADEFRARSLRSRLWFGVSSARHPGQAGSLIREGVGARRRSHRNCRWLLGPLLKRGIAGSYHQLSIRHLGRYLAEFQFKWNHRKAQDILVLVIAALVVGAVIPYAELIQSLESEQDNGPECELDGVPF